jgi:hypothetical protein
MVLEFFCPNGHRIVCTDDRAGQVARCPKCNAQFRIPGPDGANTTAKASQSGVAINTGVSSPGSSTTNLKAASSGIGQSATQQFAFLCPNGHRMNAPASLQGKAGQCPVCNAKFVIPQMTDNGKGELGLAADAAGADSGDIDTSGMHPLCALLRSLWNEKERGGVIELHLTGGTMVAPDWFDERHSRQSHGVFAAQAADGTVTMTIVAWDSVTRVVIRNVEGLPEGMFE